MRRLLPGVVCLAVVLVGCSNQSNGEMTEEIEELKKQIEQISLENESLVKTIEEQKAALELVVTETSDETPIYSNDDYAMILAKEIEQYPQTLYKKTTLDIDGDGEEEEIELHVNAGKTENGLFAWDDGQTWLLVVKDGEETFPLFDDFVQLGSIDFSTARFDRKPGIVMMMRSHSDRIVQRFTYDKDENGYEKVTFYKKENTANNDNQPASYAFFKDAFNLLKTAFTTKTVPVLEAGEETLQDSQERMELIYPILDDVYNAWRLLEMVAELNRELDVSLDGAIDLLHQMVNQPPTDEQMKQLQSIHDVFKSGTGDLIIEEENQIHPDLKEKLRSINFH
ncbi:hypothetical protein MHZ92_03790 [Sporosarcina sp. ACRSL]|uniref:hypothetical protein n=1 Tax=Sporosarcina sp. ACRSL TaxID=2918215 RepID=UPI001EF3D66E|nr:hypothetical protein [Sporosarcina sp. ACRSL]MCG7343242.1 hypothetical protein [Sporosarcina sp. ACRSL]